MERIEAENGFIRTSTQLDHPAMFRLIALVLTSTFLLLALFGTSGEQVPAAHRISAMGVMGGLGGGLAGRQAHAEEARSQYVSRHHQPLKSSPEHGASVLRILPYGSVVELLDADHGNFAQVRDSTGIVGFVLVDSLSDRFPG